MKKKSLLVPLAALALGWACSEHAVNPLAPTVDQSPMTPMPGGPLFDDIANNIDLTIDAVAEEMPLTVGGPNGTTKLYVTERNGDGKNGCNFQGNQQSGDSLKVAISSSNPSAATVSPSSVTFKSCGDERTLTISPVAQGSAIITVTQTANSSAGTFNLAPGTFTVKVSPPPNTAPSLSITGVTGGATYRKGTVPVATCQVIDKEDGNSSFAATLSAITGVNAADGVGSQTASCAYTDNGGLPATGSVSYNIIYNDTSAPLVGSILDPAAPDGTNGWYKSNVSLTWTVTEGESTPTLVKTGCANQNITADQTETSYSCSAASDGGSEGPVLVKIKRDGTAPTVQLTGTTPASPNGTNGWYLDDVTAAFKATDALSGFGSPAVATKTDNVTSSSEGAAVAVASPTYTDNAGNASSLSRTFKIDKTNPTTTADPSSAANGNGWYNANVTVKFNGTDAISGLASCTADAIFNLEGANQTASGTCTDNAGRLSAPATVTVNLDKTDPTISGAPTSAANGNDWYMNDVSVKWTCADGLSGVVNCPANTLISGEGSNLSASALISDKADNTASATVGGINIDKTNPTVSAAVSPASANGNGWYNANVTVTFTGSDAGSGIASCTAESVFTAEGKDQKASGTCTDKSGRKSSEASVTVSIDKTDPTISGSPTTAANANNWYKDDVSIKWTCYDALSGIVACPPNSVLGTEGSNLSATESVSDKADNSASATVSGINLDKTDPTVTTEVSPASANGNGWYKSDVTVNFKGSDALSGIDDCTTDAVFTVEGANQKATGSCTDKAGRSSTPATVTVNLDKTDPTISGAATTAANAKGWYKSDVNIHWTCTDALSGVVDCPANSVISTEGLNQSANASVSDKADNSASATVSGIKLDKTAPTVTPVVSPAANAFGWHNGNATVKFNGSDALSDIDDCTADVTVSAEGASQAIPGTCTDNAGNKGSASASVSIDKTAPTISGAPTTAANGEGWYNTNVSVHWTCGDGLSGVVSCPADSEISTEGSNGSAAASVNDKAGNSASATVAGIKIDKTKPTNVAFSGGVANGGIYYYSFVPGQPTCTASDPLSGVKSCVVSGYDAGLGSHTLTATATDRAGNVETATLTYTVKNWTIGGFYQPVDMNGVLNTVKGGSTVPLKFEIFAGTTELTATSSVKGFSATMVACNLAGTVDEIEITSTGGTSLRYDATGGQFIQNWQTPKTPGACLRTTITTLDDSKISAIFQLK
jgi:hypothetical protein